MILNVDYNKYLGEVDPYSDEVRTYIYDIGDDDVIFPPQEDAPCTDGEGIFWFSNYDLEYEYKNDIIFLSCNEQYVHPSRFFLKDVIVTEDKVQFVCENGTTFYVENDKRLLKPYINSEGNTTNTSKSFFGKKSILEHNFNKVNMRNDKRYGWKSNVDSYRVDCDGIKSFRVEIHHGVEFHSYVRYCGVVECIHDGVTTFIVQEEDILGFKYIGKNSPFPFKSGNDESLCYGEIEEQLMAEVKYENKNDIIFYWTEEERMFHTRFYVRDVWAVDSCLTFLCEDEKVVCVRVKESVHNSDYDEIIHEEHEENKKNSNTLYNQYKGKKSVLACYFDNVEFRNDMCYGWPKEVDSYITEDVIECIHDGVTTFIVPVEACENLLCRFPG